jgi:uncharacterized membrane protein YjdF
VGYYSKRRVKSEAERRLGAFDVILVVLCIAAVAGLVAWIIANAGGGHFLF